MKGKLITLEGSEGAGKSTNIQFIAELLRAHCCNFIQLREPGGTELSEEIRTILLKNRTQNVAPIAELLLMFASRAQLIHEKIRPALQAGQWVLCDRFIDASYAYQGSGRALGNDMIATLEQWVLPDIKPDLTLFVDVDVETGLQRASQADEADRFEQEQIAFFNKVREGYLQRVKTDPIRCRCIDGNQPLERVQQSIGTEITSFLQQQGYVRQ